MFALTNYCFLYQELCVFVYRPVKKLHSAPLSEFPWNKRPFLSHISINVKNSKIPHQSALKNPEEYSTHVNSEVFQTFELAQALLQLGVDLQGLGFGVFKEGPELLQSVKLA